MFCCVLNLDGEPVSPGVRERYAARVRTLAEDDPVEEVDAGAFVAWVVPARVPLRPLWARRGGRVAVGNVRLDHPEEVRRWGGRRESDASPLELVLDGYEARGEKCLREMLGDFSVVIYEASTRRLVAARDPFGVKLLCYASNGGLLTLGSRASLLHLTDSYDPEYVADFLADGDGAMPNTVYAGVSALISGGVLTLDSSGVLRVQRYWRPDDFFPSKDGEDCIAEFRALFEDAVISRLIDGVPTWAELSGGTDSSSIVSVAQTLGSKTSRCVQVEGTITIVDQLGGGDERRYSDLVLAQCGLRNREVIDYWAWQSCGKAPPKTDQPHVHYPFFARDAHLCALVRDSGGRVLLSGLGSDHYLYGSRSYIADEIADGHLAAGLREVISWSLMERQSVWKVLKRDAIEPFLPHIVRSALARREEQPPPWIDRTFARRSGFSRYLPPFRNRRARAGSAFALETANAVREVSKWLPRGPFEDGLEVRFPFLSRRLVEFCMTLLPRMRIRRGIRKWILREAMRGILPEPIRARTGKGSIEARTIWSLSRERRRLDVLLRDPILAQLGCICPHRLRAAVDDARNGRVVNLVLLLSTLSLETWLAVRSGRWPADG